MLLQGDSPTVYGEGNMKGILIAGIVGSFGLTIFATPSEACGRDH